MRSKGPVKRVTSCSGKARGRSNELQAHRVKGRSNELQAGQVKQEAGQTSYKLIR